MRDLELRGAGDLLGAEQSGHVAAIGFELYVEMLDQAVDELRAAGGGERTEEEVRVDTDVSAFVPSSYVPYEAAKIDIHRRIAGARAPGELRALRDELRDRFGPPPEPIEALLAIQRARIELARDGATQPRRSAARGSSPSRSTSTPSGSGACASGFRTRSTAPARARLTLRAPDADAPEAERVERLAQLADAISASREPAAEAA